MRLRSFYQCRILGDMGRSRTATATDNIYQSFFDKRFDMDSHLFGCLIIRTETVRQPGIRIGTDKVRGMLGQFRQIRLHIGRTERAVQADADQIDMLDRCQKSTQRLSRQRASPLSRQRQGQHDGQVFAFFLQCCFSCLESGFHVQRIEGRLEKDEIDTAVDQGLHLFLICFIYIFIGNGTVSRVAYIGAHGGSLVGRTDRAGNKNSPVGMFRHELIGHFASQLTGGQVYFAHIFLHGVIFHRDRVGIECVGGKNIGPSIQVLPVNGFDHVRTGDTQQVVVPFQLSGEIGKTVAAIILFIEFEPLDHGTHTTIQYQDTLLQRSYK